LGCGCRRQRGRAAGVQGHLARFVTVEVLTPVVLLSPIVEDPERQLLWHRRPLPPPLTLGGSGGKGHRRGKGERESVLLGGGGHRSLLLSGRGNEGGAEVRGSCDAHGELLEPQVSCRRHGRRGTTWLTCGRSSSGCTISSTPVECSEQGYDQPPTRRGRGGRRPLAVVVIQVEVALDEGPKRGVSWSARASRLPRNCSSMMSQDYRAVPPRS
jgi:hypothetical protein